MMSKTDLFCENIHSSCEDVRNGEGTSRGRFCKQSLKSKFDKEWSLATQNADKEFSSQLSRSGGGWCDALSHSISNVNAKQAWKNGTEKISQTLSTVRTTFGVLSQKIKKSTKRRQPLINLESPKTPITPYTRSKAVLGRTPTKLYSPFSIDTPTGKENRSCAKKLNLNKGSVRTNKKMTHKTKEDLSSKINNHSSSGSGPKLSNDLLQTQIGIYEFQSVANRIVQTGLK